MRQRLKYFVTWSLLFSAALLHLSLDFLAQSVRTRSYAVVVYPETANITSARGVAGGCIWVGSRRHSDHCPTSHTSPWHAATPRLSRFPWNSSDSIFRPSLSPKISTRHRPAELCFRQSRAVSSLWIANLAIRLRNSRIYRRPSVPKHVDHTLFKQHVKTTTSKQINCVKITLYYIPYHSSYFRFKSMSSGGKELFHKID